ncbi:MOSC domain-containing protein [Actinoplanes sp. NPDC051343]|uniref:MOSC domain-containing protein n=1 Tax=Actinoplanes sp. NPDC051343 TaxID=3363906 RepID=UPI0037B51B81
MSGGRLLSLNVGLPKDVAWQGRTVHTGVFKSPVDGARMVRRLNIDGDGQGDLAGHGGEMRAVLVYQRESYEHWQQHLHRDRLDFGSFGENFTVEGLPDHEVHIGDRYRIGEAEFEVTQPRVTCFRVGMRLGEPAMPSLLVAHRRPGFYLRVIAEGRVASGDEIVRTRVGKHALSVAQIDGLLYLPHRDPETLRKAVTIEALSPGWQQSFRDMLAAVEKGGPIDTPAVGVEPGWPGFRPLVVVRAQAETPFVTSFWLGTPDGSALPAPAPGQFLTVRVSSAGDPPPVRSYSISGVPDARSYRISVKREPHGTVSDYLHDKLLAGATVEAAAPRGDFTLADGDGPVVLVSAGIGATPVLAMLRRLADQHSPREVWWLHAARDPAEHAFAAEAHKLLAGLSHAHERIFYSRPPAPAPGAAWTAGRLTGDAVRALGLPVHATAYVCGPDAFMVAMREALVAAGLPAGNVHSELFGARPPINPGVTGVHVVPPHQPPGTPGTGPLVTFARSGMSSRASARFGSLLELAEACDVPTQWSCRTGVCHTCVTPLLSGTIDYTNPPLEEPGPGEVLVCCAQPHDDVVLDL